MRIQVVSLSFLNNRDGSLSTSKPKAYVNYILLDEHFKPVITGDSCNSGFDPVGMDQQFKVSVISNRELTKNGYLYVFVSNETPNVDVYTDNLQVTHLPGPLLEESHYYPFGLQMAGISSNALNFGAANKRKYNNGSELQNKEFSDGSGLELYTTPLRILDPQIGRWWQIDPKPDYAQSLYSSMGNNPILYNDPLGDTLRIQFRTGFLGWGKKKVVIYNNGSLTNEDGSKYTDKARGFLKQAVNALNESRTNSSEASAMITELQGSKNNFTIVKESSSSFKSDPSDKAYANQIQTDPEQANKQRGLKASGFNFAGGSGGTIKWNPKGTSVWVVGGQTNISSTTDLMHEMFHGLDANRGLSDERKPDPTYNISRSEWQAVYRENIVRQQMRLPLRTHYIDNQDPNGNPIGGGGPLMLTPSNQPLLPAWYKH